MPEKWNTHRCVTEEIHNRTRTGKYIPAANLAKPSASVFATAYISFAGFYYFFPTCVCNGIYIPLQVLFIFRPEWYDLRRNNRVAGWLTSILHRMGVVLMDKKDKKFFDSKDLMSFGMFILALLTFIYLICH